MKEMEEKKGRKRRQFDDDDEVNDAEESNAFRMKLKGKQKRVHNGRRKF